MARLLPNTQKQKELIEAYSVNMAYNASRENGWGNGIKDGHVSSKKGKGKSIDSGKGESVVAGNSTVRNNIADNVMSTVKELQSSFRASEEEVEVLSKDGYRESSGPGESTKLKNQIESLSAGGGANKNSGNGDGKSKQRKKTSKFHRVRLGDGSVEALLHQKNTDPDPDPGPNLKESSSVGPDNPSESLPARGVWRNGGGQKLFAMTLKGPRN
ncbi:UNVERIFIED_CONTAM: hypothetical protein Scaly_0333800 [Sesamum calycinum]|uniref:Uncharacterized protein n=1 Tax=Sesamum calycinum TaxID=2727403 RepID=A0AAW2SCD2_9LAMI